MEGVREFLESARQHHIVKGHFLGLLHVLIGRTIARADGTVVSNGLSWRQLAELLREMRWDKEFVRELGIEPDTLPPRDRQRFWYSAIIAANVGSDAAVVSADRLAKKAKSLGFLVSERLAS